MIVNVSVEFSFQTVKFLIPTLHNLITVSLLQIMTVGLLPRWALKIGQGHTKVKWKRQVWLPKRGQTWISEGQNKSVRIGGCWNCEAMIIQLNSKIKVTLYALSLCSWHRVFRQNTRNVERLSVLTRGHIESMVCVRDGYNTRGQAWAIRLLMCSREYHWAGLRWWKGVILLTLPLIAQLMSKDTNRSGPDLGVRAWRL